MLFYKFSEINGKSREVGILLEEEFNKYLLAKNITIILTITFKSISLMFKLNQSNMRNFTSISVC